MGFKFFNNDDTFENIFDEAERLEADVMRERDEVYEMLQHQNLPLAEGEILQTETLRRHDPEQNSPPAVFTSVLRNRDTISDEEYTHILRQQRRYLIESMWETGQVMHTIVSQDDNGFTLRTEILF